ncbi:hypothetical protein [Phocaeicola sp.]
MALTEELPIYRATYRLLNMLIRATQDFPRFYKYSLGVRMVDVCLDMSMLLYKANSSYEKNPQILWILKDLCYLYYPRHLSATKLVWNRSG